MSRHLRTYISLIFIGLSSLLPAQQTAEPVRPGTILLSAFQTVSEGEKLEEKKQFKDAWNKYQQALRYYQSLSAAHPTWKPHIVQGRIESTQKAIKRIEPMAQKEFMTEQAKLQHFVQGSGAQGDKLTPAAVANDPDQLRQLSKLMSRINAQQRELEALKNKNTAESQKYTKRIKKLETELRKHQQGLGAESSQSRQLNAQIARLQQELRKSQQLNQSGQQELIATIDKLQRTRNALATAPLRADVEKLQQQKDRQEKELVLISKAYSSTKKSLELKTLENRKLKDEITLTKSLLAQKTKDLETSQKNTASVVKTMREEINTLKSKLTEAEAIIASQKTEIADLVHRLSESEALSNELKNDLANMTAERDQLSEMLKLSDADRGKQLMKENLRLGLELRTAKQNLIQINKDKNAALDEVTKAETDLAIAKHQLKQKREENITYRKSIANLQDSLKEANDLLAQRAGKPQLDDAAREEADLLKQTVNRLIAQSTRRHKAERLLWKEYQRVAPGNADFEEKYVELAGEDIKLTDRERQMLIKHESEGTLTSPLSNVSNQARKIAQAQADVKIDTYHDIAKRLIEKNNYAFAKDIYDEAYDAIPDYSLLINRGVIRMRLREIEDAEGIFELGTAQRPRNPYTHFMLGLSRFHQDNDDLAAKSIDRAIELRPDYKEAILYRGIIEARNQRYQKALGYFQDTIELDPEYEMAHFNMAMTHHMMGNNNKAVETYNNALRAGLAPNLDFERKIGIKKATPANTQQPVKAKAETPNTEDAGQD